MEKAKEMREQAREFITLLRSNAPEEREQAAVMIYQEGMLAYKRIVQAGRQPDDNDNGGRRTA